MAKNKLEKIKLFEKRVRLVRYQKHTLFRIREKSEHSLYARENSSDEYAADRLESGTKTAVSQTIHQLDKAERWGVRESRQNVSKAVEKFQKSQAEKLVRQAQAKPEVQIHSPQPIRRTGKSIGQSAKSIGQMGKSSTKAARTTIKTAQHTAKSGIKTAQHTIKTAEQAGKVSVKTAEQTAKTVQQTAQTTAKAVKVAIPVIKDAAKAAVAGAKAAAKAVVAAVKGVAAGAKALAAAIAAGGWIVVVVIIIFCCIGGVFALLLNGGQPVVPETNWIGTGIFEWPLPRDYTITSPFGYRENPITGQISFHSGTDIAAPEATPILAAADGTVTIANGSDSWGESYGYYVKIQHDETYETLYAHCLAVFVTVGQEVKQGEIIALVGSTGNSTGNHLHFEVRGEGLEVDAMGFFERVKIPEDKTIFEL